MSHDRHRLIEELAGCGVFVFGDEAGGDIAFRGSDLPRAAGSLFEPDHFAKNRFALRRAAVATCG